MTSEITEQQLDSSAQDDPDLRQAQEERLRTTWAAPKGWRYWSAVNNDQVGVWYTAGALAFLIFGGALALIMRAQLAFPGNDLVDADLYNQLFTLHGTVMMFLFAVPIFEAVAILFLPEMLCARDLPFPRLSSYGFWSFLIGGVFVCGSILFDAAPKAGWFMYPPLSTDPHQSGIGVDIWLLGLSFIEIASVAAAVELIVGVLKCRPPGMHMNLTPLYAWYVLVVAGMILFAFPPLIAGDYLLELQRAFDWPFFDAARGGDPLLWQHLFWIFGHPEVYIIFLPAIAILAMLVPTFARRPVVGYSWIVLSAIGTGFLSFGLWVHHMFTTGLPTISIGFFSAASEAVAIPTGIQVLALVSTVLLGRRVSTSTPMLFAFGALAVFVAGGLTGVMVALAPFDFQAHDTYFVVAHLHYTLFGGVVFPVLAGIYYYFPLAAARKLSERLGRWAFWLIFIGFNAAFLPMHVTGLRGMPRRIFTYPDDLGWNTLNLVSSVGAALIGLGFCIVIFDVLRPKRSEPPPPRNPWNAGTLEWVGRIPGESWGSRCVPVIESRYPLWYQEDFERRVDEGRFYLNDAEEMKRETLITTVLDAEPVQCARVPGPSFLPMIAAIFTGAVFIFGTYHWWILTGVSAALALATILVWLWTGTSPIPEKLEKHVGHGLHLPLYVSGPHSVGWWAMLITMLGDLTAFLSVLFGYFFFWTVHADFPPPHLPGPGIAWPAIGAALLLAAWGLTWAARQVNDRGGETATRAILGAAIGLAGTGCLALVAGPMQAGMNPQEHVYPAIVWALVVWVIVHVAVGTVMQAYCVARSFAGRLDARYDGDLWNVSLYWHFVAFTVAATVLVIAGFPLVSGGLVDG